MHTATCESSRRAPGVPSLTRLVAVFLPLERHRLAPFRAHRVRPVERVTLGVDVHVTVGVVHVAEVADLEHVPDLVRRHVAQIRVLARHRDLAVLELVPVAFAHTRCGSPNENLSSPPSNMKISRPVAQMSSRKVIVPSVVIVSPPDSSPRAVMTVPTAMVSLERSLAMRLAHSRPACS